MNSKLFDAKYNGLFKYSKKVPSSLHNLFHISFRDQLEGIWVPKRPDGDYDEDNWTGNLPETTEARISLSPTIEQCFQAVFANVKSFYQKGNVDKLEFYVYKPEFKGNERIVFPEELSKNKLVHDAHVTEEHCLITPVYMKKVGKVSIKSPDPKNNVDYYAYDIKTKEGYYGHLPGKIKVTKLEGNF